MTAAAGVSVRHRRTDAGFIWERLESHAAAHPNAPAILEPGGGEFTFAQLWTMLETLDGLLREHGLGPDHTIAAVLPEGACSLVSLLGATLVCACSPMNPDLTDEELTADLLELGAVAVLTSAQAATPHAVAIRLGLLLIEAELTPRGCTWRSVSDCCAGESRPLTRPSSDHGGAVVLLHTSATTAHRKLVPLTTANLQAMFECTRASMGLGAEDRLLLMARSFHTQGVLSPCAQLLAGGSVIATRGFSPRHFLAWLKELRPTWYTCGPTLHRSILALLEQHPLAPPHSLRFVRSGGSPLPPSLRRGLEQALCVPVLDVYGLSETGAVACTRIGAEQRGQSVGTSMGPEIGIMNASGKLLQPGEEGEIVVAGPSVFAGYLHAPEANEAAFHEGWFRTGDLGRLDRDGFLFVTGRLKEIINRGAQKIVPSEIDAVLAQHPAVGEAAAFGVPHPTLGEDVACAVVLHEGVAADARELRSFMAQRLAAYKIPRRLYQVHAIPNGATGKPQRLVLRERSASFALLPADPPAPSASGVPKDLNQSLRALWSRTLGSQAVASSQDDEREDFFTLGGDSLQAVAMLAELDSTLGLKYPLRAARFYEHPTLSTLTHLVTEALKGGAEPGLSCAIEVLPVVSILPVQQQGSKPPLFLVPPDGEEGVALRCLARHLPGDWPLFLVRPGDTWHRRTIGSIEEAGAQTAIAIRAARAHGPYLIGGSCFGGAVAFEAVRLLEQQGERALLVLFDAGAPGTPNPWREWRPFLRAAQYRLRLAWHLRSLRPVLGFLRRLLRRAAWFAIRRTLSSRCAPLTPAEGRRALPKALYGFAQYGYFPLYRPAPVRAPILHFLAQGEEDPIIAASRHGWPQVRSARLQQVWLPGNHRTLFRESNLPQMAAALASWAKNCLTLPHEPPPTLP